MSFLTIHAQQVTNIKVTQEVDNVVITYDISSNKPEQTFDIKVECSTDSGNTFSINPKSLTGDLKGIKGGTTKQIVWDVLSERQELAGDQFVFQIVATYSGNNETFIDNRDGHVYKLVKIGAQVWMAENLAFLPSVSASSESSKIKPIYYVYDYNGINITEAKSAKYYKTYGVLYNWPSAKVACPKGWHLPSDIEWENMVNFLGGASLGGGKVKDSGSSHWYPPNSGATNETAFNALPSGYCFFIDGTFNNLGYESFWWSSTEINIDSALARKLYYNYQSISTFDYCKSDGFSVRCIKD